MSSLSILPTTDDLIASETSQSKKSPLFGNRCAFSARDVMCFASEKTSQRRNTSRTGPRCSPLHLSSFNVNSNSAAFIVWKNPPRLEFFIAPVRKVRPLHRVGCPDSSRPLRVAAPGRQILSRQDSADSGILAEEVIEDSPVFGTGHGKHLRTLRTKGEWPR